MALEVNETTFLVPLHFMEDFTGSETILFICLFSGYERSIGFPESLSLGGPFVFLDGIGVGPSRIMVVAREHLPVVSNDRRLDTPELRIGYALEKSLLRTTFIAVGLRFLLLFS